MDQQYKTTGGILSGIIVLFCGILILPVAIGAATALPSFIGIVGLILIVSSSLMIYGGISTLRKTRKEEAYAQKFLTEMQLTAATSSNQSKNNTTTDKPKPVILAHWFFSKEEWNTFFEEERKDIKLNSWILGILLSLLGGVVLAFSREASWALALSISSVVGAIIGFLNFKLKTQTITATNLQTVEVIIGSDTVVLAGKLIVLHDDNKWLVKVSKNEELSMPILEFTYCWNTRKGVSKDTFRIPIKSDKLNEVPNLIAEIKKANHLT